MKQKAPPKIAIFEEKKNVVIPLVQTAESFVKVIAMSSVTEILIIQNTQTSRNFMLAGCTVLNLLDLSHHNILEVCSSISLKLFSEYWV